MVKATRIGKNVHGTRKFKYALLVGPSQNQQVV